MVAARHAASSITPCSENGFRRRLIVDTDLGLDDLVALALLRVQQCIPQQTNHHASIDTNYQHTPFYLSGVTITPGISCANKENAALLRRLLPLDTPVYVSGKNDNASSLSWRDEEKPMWWARTARRVTSFLSSIPPPPVQPTGRTRMSNRKYANITAEEFIANNMDDPNVDLLCMAPLTTVARALHLRSEKHPNSSPKAEFYIMGGIRSDSKVKKRGESTAPFGYHDVVGEATASEAKNEALERTAIEKQDQFGEFNFALDILAARAVLSKVSARIIPLEACTLVPKSIRSAAEDSLTLSSLLSHSKQLLHPNHDATNFASSDSAYDLYAARSILLKLLQEYGTTETQWDSISAAIYCNAFGSACVKDSEKRALLIQADAKELSLSDLGALSFPGRQLEERMPDNRRNSHWIYPTFSTEDESTFFNYLSFLLYSDATG